MIFVYFLAFYLAANKNYCTFAGICGNLPLNLKDVKT